MITKILSYFYSHNKETKIIYAILLILSFISVFRNTFIKLTTDWLSNSNYSHGFLIPFITAYMIWQKKDQLAKIDIKPNNYGLSLIIFGMCILVVGNIGAVLFFSRIAIVITVFGLSFYLLGSSITTKIAIPIAYLAFMIPLPAILWNKLSFPLQLFAANISSKVIQFLGIPLLREGNILYLPNTALEVVDACSGLRSLTSLLSLGAAFAYIVKLSKINKLILFFITIPIAVIINIMRLISTALLAVYISPETAHGFLHGLSGVLLFIIAIVMLFGIYSAMRAIEKE